MFSDAVFSLLMRAACARVYVTIIDTDYDCHALMSPQFYASHRFFRQDDVDAIRLLPLRFR